MEDLIRAMIVGGVATAWAFLGVTLYQNLRLLREFWREREVRLLLLSHVTLKAWVFAYTLILLASLFVGGLAPPVRLAASLALVLALNAQAGGTALTYARWRDRGDRSLASLVREVRAKREVTDA